MVSSTYPHPLFPLLPAGRRRGEKSGGYAQTPTRWGAPLLDSPVTQTSQPYNVILSEAKNLRRIRSRPSFGQGRNSIPLMVRQVPPMGRAHHPDNPDLSRRYRYRYRRDIGNNGTRSLPKARLTTSGSSSAHPEFIEGSPRACRRVTLSQSRGNPEHVQGPANFQQATVILSPDNQTLMVRSRQRDGQAHHERFVSPLTLSLSKGEQVLHTKHSCPQHVGEPPQIYTGANI